MSNLLISLIPFWSSSIQTGIVFGPILGPNSGGPPASTHFRTLYAHSVQCVQQQTTDSCIQCAGQRVAQGRGLAGGQRSPLLDCSGGHVYGGRPKAALACKLILAPMFRKSTVSSKRFKRLLPAATQQKTVAFRFRLARLWRALISSIYIYIYCPKPN